jgi:hypothetical protein
MIFPDQATMNQIKAAFEADKTIAERYKKDVHVGTIRQSYVVIGSNTKFHAIYESGTWHFKFDSLYR